MPIVTAAGLAISLQLGKRGFPTKSHPLLRNLVIATPLDEASGTRRDHSGLGNNLTDNGTVTGNPGPSGFLPLASQFTRLNGEFLTIADNSTITTGDIDYWVNVNVYFDTTPGLGDYFALVTKYNSVTVRDYQLLLENSGGTLRFFWEVFDGATSIGVIRATTFGTPTTATWYSVAAYHSASLNQIGISVNNGPVDTLATTGPAGRSAATLGIGRRDAVNTFYHDGRIAMVLFHKRVPPTREQTWLYNRGLGRSTRQIGLIE